MDRDFEYEEWLDSQQDEYFNRCHDVQCQACKYQEAATEAILRQEGWHLSRNGEFCPSHADYPAHQQLIERSKYQRAA
jgi:hypothetical protein